MAETTVHLAKLEGMMGHALPTAWKDLLRAYPRTLAERTYPGLTRRIADHELLDRIEQVVTLNEFVREDPVWGGGDDEEGPWKPARLAIGKDMGGDIVFIDTSRADAPVERYVVSSGRVITMAPDIASLVRQLDTADAEVPRG